MKILQILTDTNIGGAGKYLLALLGSYDRAQFSMEVVLPKGSRLIPEVTALDIVVHEVPYIDDRSFSFKGVWKLYKVIKNIRPDIVNTHASLAGRIAAKLAGCRVVFTRHYCVAISKWGFLNNIFNDGIIAVSPEVARGLTAIGTNPDKITTIFNGVPPLQEISIDERTRIRNDYGISASSFVISHIARFDGIKGHDHVLDAAKILMKESRFKNQMVILLAGDGPLEEHIKNRIREEEIDNVVLAGFVPSSKIYEVFNITDLQVNASYTEATCMALLEGFSLGIPAVATDVGGNPYVVTPNCGVTVPPSSGYTLAKTIIKIQDNKALYKKFSDEAKKMYDKKFSADIMTRQIEDLYRKKGGYV